MFKKIKQKGFTLVETIIVLLILAIMAAIGIPSMLGYVEEAKNAQYIAEARVGYVAATIGIDRYLASMSDKFDQNAIDVTIREEVSRQFGEPPTYNIYGYELDKSTHKLTKIEFFELSHNKRIIFESNKEARVMNDE